MDIEKVKDAVSSGLSIPVYAYGDNEAACFLASCLRTIKAELEKPAVNDAFHCAKELTGIIGQLEYSLYREGVLGDVTGKAYSSFGSRMMADMLSPIQEKLHQYAESYHTKKCAKCDIKTAMPFNKCIKLDNPCFTRNGIFCTNKTPCRR